MKKLLLAIALATAGIAANAAAELNMLWLNDGVAGMATTTRQAVGHNGKMYMLNSHYGGDTNGTIEIWGPAGKEGDVRPSDGYLHGTNITIDDAGNIIARQGTFPNEFKGSGNTGVFIFNPETGQKASFNLDDSKIFGERGDFWGHVSGNVLSSNGGYLMFATSGQSYFNEVKIANGQHVLGGRNGVNNNFAMGSGVSFGTTGIISNYSWMPNEAALNDGPGSGTTPRPIYHYTFNGTTWSKDGSFYTPERNIASGFALFRMGNETYIVYSRGSNNADAIAIAKARVNRGGNELGTGSSLIVARTYAITTSSGANKYTGTQNTAVHFNVEVAPGGKKAYIYQYSPKNFIAVYEFIPEPEEVPDYNYSISCLWQNTDVAGLSGSIRQAVGSNGKMYMLNSKYGNGSQGCIEVWSSGGKEEEITPATGYLSGTNITMDDAGNIIARQGTFPNAFKGSGNTGVFVYNPTTGQKASFNLNSNKIMDGRGDFWGHVAGDVLSDEGGYLMFGTGGQTLFNEVKIANGQHVLGGRQGLKNNYDCPAGTTHGTCGLIGSYDWMPNEAVYMEGPTGNAQPKLVHMTYDRTGDTWIWRADGTYYTPERNITTGFAMFQMLGETFIVYSRGDNNADGFAVTKARVQRNGYPAISNPSELIAARVYGNTAYNGTANTTVHFSVEVSHDGYKATIYVYSPRNFIAAYEFRPDVNAPEPMRASFNRVYKHRTTASGADARQGVFANDKFYIHNRAGAVVEVWNQSGSKIATLPSKGTGPAITADEAGNIVIENTSVAWPNVTSQIRYYRIFPGGLNNPRDITAYYDANLSDAARCDYFGPIEGNIMSSSGGTLVSVFQKHPIINIAKIVNGSVASTSSMWLSTTYGSHNVASNLYGYSDADMQKAHSDYVSDFNTYSQVSAFKFGNEYVISKTNVGLKAYTYTTSTKGSNSAYPNSYKAVLVCDYTTPMSSYTCMPDDIVDSANMCGDRLFKLNDRTFVIKHVTMSGDALRVNSFAIVDDASGRVLAFWRASEHGDTEVAETAAASWFNVVPVDDHTAEVYQYFPADGAGRAFIAKYVFTID